MASLSEREKQAVRNALVTLTMLARHSLSPTQTTMATRSAGELLWLLGIEEVTLDKRTYTAAPPQGEVLDIAPSRVLAHPRPKENDRG